MKCLKIEQSNKLGYIYLKCCGAFKIIQNIWYYHNYENSKTNIQSV